MRQTNPSFKQLPTLVVAFSLAAVGVSRAATVGTQHVTHKSDRFSRTSRASRPDADDAETHTSIADVVALSTGPWQVSHHGTTVSNAIGNGVATPSSVSPGQSVAIGATFTLGSSTTIATYFEIRNSANAVVAHTQWNDQGFSTGQSRSYTWDFAVPANWPADNYHVHAGIFTADWSTNVLWVPNVTSFNVAQAAPASPPSSPTNPTTPTPTGGRAFYVDSGSGSDFSSGTSEASPWQSLNKVNSTTFQAADVINFKRGGVWTGELQVKNSGTASAPITYRAYGTGNNPQIKNPGVTWGHDVNVTGSNNVIQDFLLTDAHEAGVMIRAGAVGNVAQNNEITRTGTGVTLAGEYNRATSNYVHDLTMIVNDASPNNDYGAVCFWIQANNNEISYNKGVNCRASSSDFGYDGGFVEVWQAGDNTYVHHNYAGNTNGFFELGASNNGSAQNVRVAYNTIVNVTGQGSGTSICFNTGSYNINLGAFRFENNTFVSYAGHPDAYRVFGCRSDLSALTVRNNIFYSDIQIANNGNFTHSNNLYDMVNMVNGSGVGYGLGSQEQFADPSFVNMQGGDMRLLPGSPAIDTGMNLGYTLDYNNIPVPEGNAPDKGANEYKP